MDRTADPVCLRMKRCQTIDTFPTRRCSDRLPPRRGPARRRAAEWGCVAEGLTATHRTGCVSVLYRRSPGGTGRGRAAVLTAVIGCSCQRAFCAALKLTPDDSSKRRWVVRPWRRGSEGRATTVVRRWARRATRDRSGDSERAVRRDPTVPVSQRARCRAPADPWTPPHGGDVAKGVTVSDAGTGVDPVKARGSLRPQRRHFTCSV